MRPVVRPVLRGLALRCPRCGRGRLFGRWAFFTMQRACQACGLVYEGSDPGDFTGAMMLGQFLVGAVGLFTWIAVFGFALAAPMTVLLTWVLLFGVLLPLLLYRNVKGLWTGLLEAGAGVFDRDSEGGPGSPGQPYG